MFAKAGKTFAPPATPGMAANRLAFVEIQSGLTLHTVDLRTDGVQRQEGEIAPSLNLSFLLEGRTELRFARQRCHFGVQHRDRQAPAPRMSVFSTAQPVGFSRSLDGDMRLRHLALQISPDWLERNRLGHYGSLAPLLKGRGIGAALVSSVPSERAVILAEQLLVLGTGDAMTPLACLQRESKVLELLVHSLNGFDAVAPSPQLDARILRRLYHVRDWLESECARPLTMEELTREFGLGVDTLQRQFRQVFGTTVFAYLHEHRMQRARQALEDGAPVSVAAYAVGYGSPANFATAFKRRFGVVPKRVRMGPR
ncbi:MAG TPA: AraC family transcriptional regulator [Hyphomicrobiales bacterium]|nr:AraC family transcriptional regulator [Hyphomicrobiales bacterium]